MAGTMQRSELNATAVCLRLCMATTTTPSLHKYILFPGGDFYFLSINTLKWLLIRSDWLFPGTTSAQQSHSRQAAWTKLFSDGWEGGRVGGANGGCSTGFATVWLLFQHPRITITEPLLLGLNDRTLQKAAAGTLPEQRQVGLIGSGAAILAAYLIASWEKSPLKWESKHVDCRKLRMSNDGEKGCYL